MNQREMVNHCRAIAMVAHAGQKDKGGAPYFGHCERVAQSDRLIGYAEMAAGYLHDVIEDTPITEDILMDLFVPEEVLAIVDLVTRRDGEPYFDFIARVATDASAIRVKLANLDDNLDTSRWPEMPSEYVWRYRMAQRILTTKLEEIQ